MSMSRIGRKANLLPLTAIAVGVSMETQVLAQEQLLEEVTVTGTRILRRDFSSQSPIVTIEAETFVERSNIGLEAALNQLPQFTVAGTQAQNSPAGTPFPQASAAPGAGTLNLRGLGLNRSLVLVDGRRAQPINGLLVVDVNTIPSAAIERVEVITGGAAAVYGADAIAGVVNFILKDDFEGLEFSGQYGLTEEGDGGETQFSALMGADFADGRGNVMLGLNYSNREIIYSRDRDWIVEGWQDPGTAAGGINSSNLTQYDPATASYCGIANCGQPPAFVGNAPTAGFPLDGGSIYGIDQNGNLFDPSDPLDAANPYTGPIGGGYPNEFKINPVNDTGLRTLGYIDREHSYMQLPFERYSIFGAGHIDLSDDVRLFTDLRFSETFTKSSGFVSSLFNVWSPTVPYDPANDDPDSPTFGQTFPRHPVPAQFADLLNSRPVPDAPWTYVGGLDYIPNFTTETTSNVYQLIAGLEGDATVGGHDWSWEFFTSQGKTTVNARQPEGFPFLPRLQNLFNADMYGQNFDNLNLPGAVPLAVTGTCTSGLPIFNADGSVNNTPSVSDDCADYIVLRMNNVTELTQDVIEANVTGSLAEMPAGELQFALGISHREEDFSYDPDTGYNANQDYPVVIQNIILPVAVAGKTKVDEIYGEMAIPLISDRKFVQSLEIDPGFRYSDYNTVGSEETYKIMGHWEVNDRLRFRGGYQLATRAPNVTELFTPIGGSMLFFGGVTDACAYYPSATQPWGNRPENPNRLNLQIACQYLMTREGAPPTLYEPGMTSADTYDYNVFGGRSYFPATIGVTEGNPALQSESADTYTAGIVLSFDRVTLAIDWYEIELENAIGVPAHGTIYQQCLDPTYNPLIGDAPGSHTGAELIAGNQFCDLIQREYVGGAPLTPGNYGADRKYSAQYINQGGIRSEGIDVQLDWGFDVGAGALSLGVVASFLDTYAESPFPGADFIDYTGTQQNDSFDYQTYTTLRYQTGSWGVGVRWQHLPSIDPAPSAADDVRGVDAHDQLDLFANWTFNDRFSLRAGIDNLLNEDPPIVGATPFDNNRGTTNSNYDQFGRRYFLGLTVNL